ncbi:MAG TPA: DinB family protein [Candidatus Eisenbacteria bacterium]|nr:DinB family protein [Candidatus Eisenbacteria bacterium]
MKLFRLVLALLALTVVAPGPIRADEPAPTGLKAELLHSLDDVAEKLADLAQATPADKYNYRPGDGVRSTAEVFLHVAGGNYMFPGMFGVKAPDGINLKTLEKSTTDKAQVQKILGDSFDYARAAIRGVPDDGWDRSIQMFGKPATVRACCLTMVTHMHEHLGQSIAYARVNGIVPPWTARAEEAAKQKKASGM